MVQTTETTEEAASEGQPQFFGTTVSNLCSVLPRPLIITGLLRELMVRHFSKAEYIETPELAHLLWQSGEKTPILISSITKWEPETTERRPAIIIKRNSYRNRRMGIGDRNQGPSTDRFGDNHYTTFWVGSHTLFCIARSGGQAELLATEVQRELHQFHPLIRRSALLHRFQVTEVGAIAEVEEATENFVVPVTVSYAYEDRWVLSQEAPVLRSLRLSFVVDC